MTITVNVSDARSSSDPADVLVTYALGSCIGVCVYDPVAAVAGLLHFQLPTSTLDPDKAVTNPFMFADTGFTRLIEMVLQAGAQKRRLHIKLAGGAAMLNDASSFNIGKRNHAAIRKILWQHGLFIASEDVGGGAPRTVYLKVNDGAFTIKSGGITKVA
jgi:chemotaxis protein CheD